MKCAIDKNLVCVLLSCISNYTNNGNFDSVQFRRENLIV
uniref:Uncharacterized protein n=1 Tax=Anguilla anguilla TaxID=7936 RepID=A0A0E9R3F4_ANGAN